MECKIDRVLLNNERRTEYVRELLKLDGLESVDENRNGVYCALPFSGASPKQRCFIEEEHELIKACMKEAGLEIYDPKDSETNPWVKLVGKPQEVYDLDTIQLVTPRFFEFTNVCPSTGAGIEQHKAITYAKIAVVVTKVGVYTSRMSTGARRTILIEYSNADEQQEEIAGVFKTLKKYEPGIGNCSVHGNTLLGFYDSGPAVCLPGLIAQKFPDLVYDFDKYLTKA